MVVVVCSVASGVVLDSLPFSRWSGFAKVV